MHAEMEPRMFMIVFACFSFANTGSLKNSTEIEVNSAATAAPALYGGDILLTPAQRTMLEEASTGLLPSQRAVTTDRQALWENAQVPYVLDSSLSNAAKVAIATAISNYKKRSCVRFVPRTNEEDHVRFFKGEGCFSMVGRVGGQQDISIGPGCEIPGIVMHEMFHSLGRWHEHSRPDRDLYVQIQYENVMSGSEINFEKLSTFVATTQGITYDFDSIMHYLPNAFSANGKVTVKPQDKDIILSRLGQRVNFSSYDLQHVNALYCSDDTTATWGSWSSWTACSQTCNGGVRIRTRACEGGSNCVGSNIDTKQCNTAACPVAATWTAWSVWSACSASCGGGRQQRVRTCLGGNICEGLRTEFRDCNTQSCSSVPTWSSWGPWSSCSSTCGKGTRTRTRTCMGGSTCVGMNTEVMECNTLNCTTATYKGCFYLSTNNVRLGSLDGSTPDLSDTPRSRMNAVVKCQQAATQFGFEIFAISLGYCISGSNRLSDYQLNPASDDSCHNGLGGRVSGRFAMDLYQIPVAGTLSDQVPRQPLVPIPLMNTMESPLSHDVVATMVQDPSSSGTDQLSTPCALLLLLIIMGTSNAILDMS